MTGRASEARCGYSAPGSKAMKGEKGGEEEEAGVGRTEPCLHRSGQRGGTGEMASVLEEGYRQVV